MAALAAALRRRWSALVLAGALGIAGPALAQERLDHRGSVGLLLGGVAEFKGGYRFSGETDSHYRLGPELGGSWALTADGDELKLVGRATLGGTPHLSLLLGYRSYFGQDRWKTFLDVDGLFHLNPLTALGPRLGFGLQYELSSLVGLYAGVGAFVGVGGGLRFGADAQLGLQVRSYLLE